MAKATLVLLRHGQTADNITRIATGHTDVPLTPLGMKQARAAGALIGGIRFDKVYSSPLSRASHTAQLVLEGSGTQQHLKSTNGAWQIEQRKEIIEIDDGALTGRSMVDDPAVVDFFKNATFADAPPEGESAKQLVARVRKFYAEEIMPRLERGENVLIVAHVNTLRAFDIAMGTSPLPVDGAPWTNKRKIANATPNVAEYADGKLKRFYEIENPVKVGAVRKRMGPKIKGVGVN